MKNYLFIILSLSLLLASCEDPIDVVLDEAPPILVVDAWLNDKPDAKQIIKLTRSQNYLQNTLATGVTDATVIVSNDSGSTFEFLHEGDGVYAYSPANNFGVVGDAFTLDIQIADERYNAKTAVQRVPMIDSIRQEFRENELFGADGYYCELMCRDFQGTGDTYWIKSWKNGQYLNRPAEINIAYDAAFDDGSMVDGLVFITPVREGINPLNDDLLFDPWEVGDTINVEVHSMSNEAFAYMEILRDQLINSLNGIFAQPLYNTRGNVVNLTGEEEVLGMFNVAAVSSVEYVIKEE